MGHCISAVLIKGQFDRDKAAQFSLSPVAANYEITIFPLNEEYCDSWAERLAIAGFVSERPLLNSRAVHHILNEIAPNAIFAVIETDYFGGEGEQSAAVYQENRELMPPETASFGPINKALKLMGVRPWFKDPFTAVGLHRYRRWEDWFEKENCSR